MPKKLKRLVLFALFAIVPSIYTTLSAGAKTDTITMYNGDKVTCEVKQLSLGKLQVKTSDMGTLNVKWYKIAILETKQVVEIVLKNRTKIYGTLSKTDSVGYVKISSGLMIEDVYRMMDIVAISQVAKSFWSGLEGSVSYGLSYAKGSSNLQSNLGATVKYRTNHFLNKMSINSIISINDEQVSRKQDASYSLFYYYKKRAFLSYTIAWQQNTELGIENRLINNVSIGYIAAETNYNLLKLSGGPLLNMEETSEKEQFQSLEAIFAASYDLNIYAHPKISIEANVSLFPSITDWGRFRSDLSAKISWEIFSDFTFGFSYYFNSDNRPTGTASATDWGTTTSLGYTF